jgi:ABC-type branched-subunit amino acid transport system substrate-binding protein
MTRYSAAVRLASLGCAASLALVACSSGGDDGDGGSTVGTIQSDHDDVLDFGLIYPATGGSSYISAPLLTAFELAIADINQAGGVNGHEVTAEIADEAGESAVVREVAAGYVNNDIDVVIGATDSGMSQEIIQMLHDSRTVQCSGSNTSPVFSGQVNNTYYFRTIPPDEAVAPVIVEAIVDDGATDVAVVARADDYGLVLAELIHDRLEAAGANVVTRVDYPTTEDDFDVDRYVSQVMGSGADAVALVSFDEGADIIGGLIDDDFRADRIYGADGLFDPGLGAAVNADDPSAIAGLQVFAPAGSQEFNDRLDDRLPDGDKGNFIYGGQIYDCVVVSALAAIAAGSVDPAVFNDAIPEITQDGAECTSFEECKGLLEAGQDIDYVGVSGPINLDRPDPTVGSYAVIRYDESGNLEQVDDVAVDLAELG